jgi:dienelactone hydrolase
MAGRATTEACESVGEAQTGTGSPLAARLVADRVVADRVVAEHVPANRSGGVDRAGARPAPQPSTDKMARTIAACGCLDPLTRQAITRPRRYGRAMRLVAFASLLVLSSCSTPEPPPKPAPPASTPSAAPTALAERVTCNDGKQVVQFTTEDGVSLAADLHVPSSGRGPAAVLLHMIPPHHDRTNYPATFIDSLVEKGITVLNVDRRGAGASKGDAKAAYEGPKGRLDAAAAVRVLVDSCKADMSRIALVGASNGTTTAVDYAVWAQEKSATAPAAIVLLTGGKYTEKQHSIAGHANALTMPVMFVYSPEEKDWSEAQKAHMQPGWAFSIYAGGAHGTKMFGAAPQAEQDVVDFLVAKLGAS